MNGDCGRFGVPGTGQTMTYAGLIKSPFTMRLGPNVSFVISGMRVLEHPHPLMLIGADILCGGRAPPSWNYEGSTLTTEGPGVVTGSLRFRRGT